jgi:hypothetical protein
MPLEALLIVIAVFGGGIAWSIHQIRILRAANALVQRLRAEGALLVVSRLNANFRVITIGENDSGWRAGVINVSPEAIFFYPRMSETDDSLSFPRDALRWFGRPLKYHDGRNEIWLHFEQAGRWHLVKMRMNRYLLADVVRALKQFAAPPLVTAYRRRRPYVHFGPVQAQPAEEDIHGAWTLDLPITLYLTPAHVVLLRGAQVQRLISLEAVQKVVAMRRIDQPNADGLVVFDAEGETFAFASKAYQALAQALADAARRSLEEPLLQKQKGKKYDEDDEE